MQYIMILLVFLLAYGISSLALQYTHRNFDFKILYKDIFYYPYWQMYGELFLDEMEGKVKNWLYFNEMVCSRSIYFLIKWMVRSRAIYFLI
jgi:transient receptor potential cation channel subfamily M protein 2